MSVLIAASAGCSGTEEVQHIQYSREIRTVRGTPSIAFVSDTQAPLWMERLWLFSDDNEMAQQRILRDISRDSTCAALFHLGDITGMGGIESEWKLFDENTRWLRDAGIPIFAAYGNHEYMPRDEAGKSNFAWRFPFIQRSWFEQRIDSVAIVILNSNISHLSEQEVDEQLRWYERTLSALDSDSSVAVVIVGCHHSPYTNSTVVEPSLEVQQLFVRLFLTSQKTALFLSGHAHALEHFQEGGKDFLVIGGGGGLLHPLLPPAEARWRDLIHHDTNRSIFHYVRLMPSPDGMTVEVLSPSMTSDGVIGAYSFKVKNSRHARQIME